MFLLVPAYPGCPGSKAVKRSLYVIYTVCRTDRYFTDIYEASEDGTETV